MDILEKKIDKHLIRQSLKRANRKIASNNNTSKQRIYNRNGAKIKTRGVKATNNDGKIIAPAFLDIYSKRNHDKLIKFIIEIEDKARQISGSLTKKLHICFRDTYMITAAAGLLLLARVENLKTNYPNIKYKISRPPVQREKKSYDKRHIVDSVLNRIGFYSLIGLPKRVMKELPNVKCWEVIRGQLVESEEAGGLIERITEKLQVDFNDLYRPLIEAMSNSVEHAYRDDLYDKSKLSYKNKWWCFAAVIDNRLSLLICDLGVGIPKTLKVTQGEGFIAWVKNKLSSNLSSDSDYIQAALEVRKSATLLGYRGKGGMDLQSIIDFHNDSTLRIFSNCGSYKYRNAVPGTKPYNKWDGQVSIEGTIIEWNIPLQPKESAV